MMKTFCDRCGRELGQYDQWRVSLSFSNDPSPPTEPRSSGTLCADCAAPAIAVVQEAHAVRQVAA